VFWLALGCESSILNHSFDRELLVPYQAFCAHTPSC
jgi:hypothetical protein